MYFTNIKMNKSGLSKFILVIFLSAVIEAAPSKSHKHHHSNRNIENENNAAGYHVVDEHQNGTDNYRISVKDIVVILVPPESLLTSAASSAASLGANFALHLRQPDLATLDNLPDSSEVSTLDTTENANEEVESTTLKEEEPVKPASDPVEEKKSDDFVAAGRTDSESFSHEYPAIVGPFLRRKIKRH